MEVSSNGIWYLSHRIKFYVLLVLQIPSIILCLFIFLFYFLHSRILHKIQYQALLILYIVNIIQLVCNLPMPIHFFHLGYINPATTIYCKWWMFLEFTLDASNAFLVMIISMQRHTLIFHPNQFHRLWKRYLFYYLPLALCLIYPICFYAGTVIFYPCAYEAFDFTANTCGDYACYLSNNTSLATYDWIFNTGLPILLTLLANITLITRVIQQKYRQQRAMNWSKQRRMTIQLCSISSLYIITWSPSIIIGMMQQIKPFDKYKLHRFQEDYISDLKYFISILLPWISLGFFPDFQKWIFNRFHHITRHQNTIVPA